MEGFPVGFLWALFNFDDFESESFLMLLLSNVAGVVTIFIYIFVREDLTLT